MTTTREQAKCETIGMLHAPIGTILAAPDRWVDALHLPHVTKSDWQEVGHLGGLAHSHQPLKCECVEASLEAVKQLSFWRYLRDRLLDEAALYERYGLTSIMLENTAAPYFIRGEQPAAIYWVMRALSSCIKERYPHLPFGIQVLAHSDDWAMDIACRCGLDFIRCESALFEGVRPEGRTPNRGNLAQLYMTRNRLRAQLEKGGAGPQVYVDIQKKHTVFMPALAALDDWLDNILFQKLEGIVITGKATGQPVAEADLRQSREAIEKAKAESQAAVGMAWAPPLIVGSGASVDNIGMCKRYADAVIVGSSLKKNGYWECPLDEERVKRFMEAWNV